MLAKMVRKKDEREREHILSNARVEINTPGHSASKALVVGPLLLGLDGVSVVVADPLVVPSQLLHHRVSVVLRRQVLLLDELLDLHQRHNAFVVGAGAWIAGPGEGAERFVAGLVLQGVAAAVERQPKVDLGGVQLGKPKGQAVVCDFADVCLAANKGT